MCIKMLSNKYVLGVMGHVYLSFYYGLKTDYDI